MKPNTFTKTSWEKRRLEFDTTNALATGDTLASITSVTILQEPENTDRSATMLYAAASMTGNKIYAIIEEGEDNIDYTVIVRGVSTNGDYIEDSILLRVRDS